ncbi:MAG: ComF family protein [Clostridia bacterium]|nr:ComF family protein [Clostridia bacterium]
MNWFPNYSCMACGTEIQSSANSYLCPKCMQQLPIMTETQTSHFSPFIYEEPIRNMILKLKYASNGFIAKALAPYLAAVYIQKIKNLFDKPPIIIPVPLHRSRHHERGYNQSAVLAKELSGYLNLPVVTNILIRNKKTIIQKKMDAASRASNLRNAFTVDPTKIKEIQNQNILLIDDVYTTGATTHECATTLRHNSVRNVIILTIASVI